MVYHTLAAYRYFCGGGVQFLIISAKGIPVPTVRGGARLCRRAGIPKSLCYMRIVYKVAVGVRLIGNNANAPRSCKLNGNIPFLSSARSENLHTGVGSAANNRCACFKSRFLGGTFLYLSYNIGGGDNRRQNRNINSAKIAQLVRPFLRNAVIKHTALRLNIIGAEHAG